MIKSKLTKALNDQVNAEYYSSYLYLAMSAYADKEGFKGIANWLFIQAQEELAHGTHIYQHILERGAAPAFNTIQAPPASFAGIEEVFEKVLAHEQYVTELINNIASLALKESDHASYNFIMWYVNEQVEEEATAGELLAKIKAVADNKGLLYTLDAQLASRAFVNPFPAAAD
ncbi:MAG: ferritin [Acidaminococcales bacterium]|jgi:ferritin|nr:ferritin [Acidaminococcales bacterium]